MVCSSLFAPLVLAGTLAATADPVDIHSHARPDEVRVRHVSLDLKLDFERRRASGSATLDVERKDASAPLVLDSRGLVVKGVTTPAGVALTWRLGEAKGRQGAPLTIELPPGVSRVVLWYAAADDADALQWLTPAQTYDGKHPYLFTQGQAILTRTWIPLQDSPGVRITYDATIRAPAALKVARSAAHVTARGLHPACVAAGIRSADEGVELMVERNRVDCAAADDEGYLAWRFSMRERIPPYLIALAAGDLAFRAIDERVGVYCEPGCVDAAAWEFADTPKMMEAAERLYGAYRWGRYDILVLPPAFPYGGMENPRLTFVSPTTVAGDRTLTAIIAHELAHSWSGNLVTNARWGDIWLNEGFTSYLEVRLLEETYGKERAQLVEALGRRDMMERVTEYGAKSPKTALAVRLKEGQGPDDGSEVAYDKGTALLRMLEEQQGRDPLDAFLRKYFDAHAFQNMTTERAMEYLTEHLLGRDEARAKALLLDEWAWQPGLPKNLTPVESALLARIEAQAKRFAAGEAIAALDARGFGALEWVLFLRALPRDLDAGKRAALDKHLSLATTKNSELRFEWLKLAVPLDPEGTEASAREFLLSQGRRRLVKPVFKALVATEHGRRVAADVFAKAKAGYHTLTVRSVEEILAGDSPQ
jgi:aminopeptidase N